MRHRPRRLRTSPAMRDIVRETVVTPNDIIVPLFVEEGNGIKNLIPSMPGYFRYSLDTVLKEVGDMRDMGFKCFLLFVKVDDKFFRLFYVFHSGFENEPKYKPIRKKTGRNSAMVGLFLKLFKKSDSTLHFYQIRI